MGDYSFIYETSNRRKIRVFLFSIFVLLILIALGLVFISLYHSFDQSAPIKAIKLVIKDEITKLTPRGLFYAALIGGSFMVPAPLEVFFYLSLAKDNSFLLSLLMINSGFALIQIVNYWLGLKLSPLFFNFVSAKKVYKTRRFINKYGVYGVFLLNLIPSPSEILTFALGITRYNVYRLFFFLILGNLIKYAVIGGFYFLIQ